MSAFEYPVYPEHALPFIDTLCVVYKPPVGSIHTRRVAVSLVNVALASIHNEM